MKVNGFLSKIMKIKGKGYILLAFIAGVILLLIPTSSEEKNAQNGFSVLTGNEYANLTERKIEETVKAYCGKKCNAAVALSSGFSYAFAADEKLESSFHESGVTISKSVSKEYVKISEDGKEKLVATKELLPQISGIAVVCKCSEREKNEIQNMLCALFDLPKESVYVI